jgi:hypothetical protein
LQEWLNWYAWKAYIRETVSRVRIPHFPPSPTEAFSVGGIFIWGLRRTLSKACKSLIVGLFCFYNDTKIFIHAQSAGEQFGEHKLRECVSRDPRSDGRNDGPAGPPPARRFMSPPSRPMHNLFPQRKQRLVDVYVMVPYLPSKKSRYASAISARLFITKGPSLTNMLKLINENKD